MLFWEKGKLQAKANACNLFFTGLKCLRRWPEQYLIDIDLCRLINRVSYCPGKGISRDRIVLVEALNALC